MDLYLARQPIFDRDEQIVAYALLHRGSEPGADGRGGAAASATDAYDMAEGFLVDAALSAGIEQLTHGRLAFLKVSTPMLTSRAIALLDPSRIALEVHSATLGDPRVRDACERLAADGYQIVLDRFRLTADTAAVLRSARVVKVDVRDHGAAALAEVAEQVLACGAQLLAEHVEQRGTFDLCVRLGFELFQGYRFTQPETVTRQELSVEHLQLFGLLKDLRDPAISDAAIEDGFRSDVALSYKLLRMVNSAAAGGRGVWSIGHAIRLLGRDTLDRWVALLLLSAGGTGGVRHEMIYTALLRARLCELVAPLVGLRPAAGPLFLVGSFSLLDAMMRMSMADVLAQLDLDEEVSLALVQREGFFGAVLALVETYEEGGWDEVTLRCEALGLDAGGLSACYLEAVGWARDRCGQLADPAPVAA